MGSLWSDLAISSDYAGEMGESSVAAEWYKR
jgi:hypothetical protein